MSHCSVQSAQHEDKDVAQGSCLGTEASELLIFYFLRDQTKKKRLCGENRLNLEHHCIIISKVRGVFSAHVARNYTLLL